MRTILKICFWNCNGISTKKTEFTDFLQNHDIDVALLNETHLKPSKRFTIPNYITHRIDRRGRKGGGTAVVIKKCLPHQALPEMKATETTTLESTGIQITLRNKINLYAAYMPPGRDFQGEELEVLLDEDTPLIIAGDLNAKHTVWNSKTTNTRGRKLIELIEEKDAAIIGPDEDTHISMANDTTDVLDVAIMKNISQKWDMEVLNELSSDHLPVIINLHLTYHELDNTITKTNWNKFKSLVKIEKKEVNNAEEIEDEVERLEKVIVEAKNQTTIKQQRPKINPLPQEIRELIRKKNRAIKNYKRTLHPADKRILNYLTHEVKTLIEKHRNEEWENRLQELCTEDQSLWRVTKVLAGKQRGITIPSIAKENGYAISEEEKAEEFARALQNQFKLNNMPNQLLEQEVEFWTNSIEHEPNNDEQIRPTTTEEVKDIIKNLNKRKAPGQDEITNRELQNLPNEGYEQIKNIINAILKTRHFPTRWKTARTILIKKPNKPPDRTNSYRPISLLSSLSKVAER